MGSKFSQITSAKPSSLVPALVNHSAAIAFPEETPYKPMLVGVGHFGALDWGEYCRPSVDHYCIRVRSGVSITHLPLVYIVSFLCRSIYTRVRSIGTPSVKR